MSTGIFHIAAWVDNEKTSTYLFERELTVDRYRQILRILGIVLSGDTLTCFERS